MIGAGSGQIGADSEQIEGVCDYFLKPIAKVLYGELIQDSWLATRMSAVPNLNFGVRSRFGSDRSRFGADRRGG